MTEIAEKKENTAINPITDGKIGKEMILFFLPLMFGTFFQLLYNTADSVIVGRFVGKEALAAVGGSAAILVNVFVGGLTSLSSGATIIVGQYYGAGRKEDVSKSVHTGMAFAVILGIIITIAGIPTTRLMLEAMNTTPESLEGSTIYLRVYMAGMIPNLVYNMGAGILRAIGDSKRPLIFLIISSIINIILDLALVIGMGLGVFGVALATIFSQAISAVMTIYVLVKANDCYKLYLNKIKIHSFYLKRILMIGIPSTVHSLTYTASNLIIQIAVNGFGTDTVAAWVATGKADQIFWMVSNSLGISISTFVAQNYGKGNMNRVKKSMICGFFYHCILTTIIVGGLLLIGPFVLTFFTKDPVVLGIATYMLRFFVVFYFSFILIEVCHGVLRGMGNATGPMIISVFGVCGIRILWIFTAFRTYRTMTVLMTSYPISWGISSAISLLYLIICLRRMKKEKTGSAGKKKMTILPLILLIAGILCILYGITIMLANSGSKFFLVWYAGGLCFVALAFLFRSGIIAKLPMAVKGIAVFLISLGVIFVIATQCMVISGFRDNTKEGLDYIIVLGSQVKTSGPAVVTRMRLDKAYEYASANPETIIIVSGGQGSNEPASEASVMKDYLVGRGIDESRILMEDKSTNTSENLQFSASLYEGLSGSSVGIVSSNFHIYRALAIAKKCGYTDVTGIPADSVKLYLPNNMIRETVGLLKDFLMGNL
ncbi:MAG: MATE family efflux transporter [Lachnospiraceae bacterium]|nr:MATE family efflux transporter [Lachnospiraceae bacterium]